VACSLNKSDKNKHSLATKQVWQYVALISIVASTAWSPAESEPASLEKDGLMLAVKKPSTHAARPSGPAKQIYELSQREETSDCLGASGVAAYVVSASGTNRGLLLRTVQSGFAASIGLQPGDVLLSVNSRVVQTGSDADRILESSPSGPARIVFVHPSENGLQLYNTQKALPTFSGMHSSHAFSSSSSSGSSNSSGSAARSNESMAALESYMIELVNHDRTDNGSPAISANGTLSSLARGHAADMAKRDFFNHTNPDGQDPQTRAHSAGIKGGIYENIAYQGGFESANKMLQNAESIMMAEPKNQINHRSNILDPKHAAVGVGVVRAANGRLYIVQEFSHESP
jgi:uncharacterized protein YkwD